MQKTIEKWLVDGKTWVGIFENKALDSANLGERCGLPFDDEYFDEAEIGKMRMPDTKTRIGWKYILIAKSRDIEEIIRLFENKEDK